MIALEVGVNGKRVCVAGLPVGAVTASVTTVRRRSRRQTSRGQARVAQSALLTVSGYTETAVAHEHPWWVPRKAIPRLRVGDSVTLRVVDVSRPNKPRTRHRQPKRQLEYYEHRDYLRLKKKYAERRSR